jgi:DNA-binding transcriptional LysR family regulator
LGVRLLEIQQLRHLIAAVDCGNLLKAADECNISQSGLSRSIGSLEDRLGVQLLYRKSKGVEPTVYGDKVLQRARLIVNEVARCSEDIRAIKTCEVGEIAFGVTQNYGYYLLPQVLADLNSTLPGIRVTVRTGGFLDLVDQLKIGAIDFVFGLLGPIEEGGDIAVERIRQHYSRVIGRNTHPLANKREEVTPEELCTAHWATLASEGFQRNFIRYFTTHSLAPPVQVIKTDSMALICQSVLSADVLAVLPPDVARKEIETGELVILDCEAPAEQTDVGIVTRRSSLVTQQRTEILKRIRKHLAR